MKNFLCACLLLLIIINPVKAQTTIEGIGKLKLEMSINEVKRAFPKMLIPMKSVYKFKKVYKINTYTPIQGHTLRDIRLYFYNDTLYAFYVKNAPSILKRSLKSKYGEPKEEIVRTDSHMLEIAAIYGYDSADFLLETIKKPKKNVNNFFYRWNNDNPFIQCVFVESLYVDGKGKDTLDYMFYIKNMLTAKLVDTKETLQKVEEEEKKKKDLDGL